MTHDEFLQAEFHKIARPDEQIISTAIGWMGPGVLLQAMMLGPLLSHLWMKYHFALLTNQRLVLIKTKMGAFKLKQQNLGVQSISGGDLESVELKGAMNQRRLTVTRKDGQEFVFRINTVMRLVAGQKEFPKLAETELNRQIATGASPMAGLATADGDTSAVDLFAGSKPTEARWVFLCLTVLAALLFGVVALVAHDEEELVIAAFVAVPVAVAGVAGWIVGKRGTFARSGAMSVAWGIGGVSMMFLFFEMIWPML